MIMKSLKILSLLICLTISMSCAKSLDDEDTRIFASENQWILDVMKNNYLFRDDMPKDANLSQQPIPFFNSLLSVNRDKNKKGNTTYSRIESDETKTKSTSSELGYGFQFISYLSKDNSVTPRVLYVIDGSPAKKAGLKRGDFITKINNENINAVNVASLHSGSNISLSISETPNAPSRTIQLNSAESINNKPLQTYSCFQRSGRKVAYVVYNHFTPGIGDDLTKDRSYDDELCTMSNFLHSEGVNEMVLDLRYNGGGQVSSAQLLSTIIAPNIALGKVFCTLKDVNKKHETYRFDENLIRNGKNLNLKRLFVLTTEFTASASELVINSLRPFMQVVIIGDVTEGKNVGSRAFKHSNYTHILKPITCYVFNSQDRADYGRGFKPDYEYKDIMIFDKQYSLGDHREAMLNIALKMIDGSITTNTKSATQAKYETGISAHYRTLRDGIVID